MDEAFLGSFGSGPPTLNALVGLAAMLLGLAVLVEVIQEVYKFFTSSKTLTYSKVLSDFAGPWIQQIFGPGPATQLHVRRPFQWLKSRPEGALLPLNKEQLLEAIDRTSADWILQAVETLKNEKMLQNGLSAPPSPSFIKTVKCLETCKPSVPGFKNVRDIVGFFETWGVLSVDRAYEGDNWKFTICKELDANKILTAFYQRFFPERLDLEKRFDQLAENFEFAYRRRNLRQTFVFALLVAVFFNFPFDELYWQATQLSPEKTTALAESVIALYEHELQERQNDSDAYMRDKISSGISTKGADIIGSDETAVSNKESDEQVSDLREQAEKILAAVLSREESNGTEAPYYSRGANRMAELSRHPIQLLTYFFNCLVTAIFISFGAPFWHRITSSLSERRRGQNLKSSVPKE